MTATLQIPNLPLILSQPVSNSASVILGWLCLPRLWRLSLPVGFEYAIPSFLNTLSLPSAQLPTPFVTSLTSSHPSGLRCPFPWGISQPFKVWCPFYVSGNTVIALSQSLSYYIAIASSCVWFVQKREIMKAGRILSCHGNLSAQHSA